MNHYLHLLVAGDGRKKYPREFLMKFKNSEVCKEVPDSLKVHELLMMEGVIINLKPYNYQPKGVSVCE